MSFSKLILKNSTCMPRNAWAYETLHGFTEAFHVTDPLGRSIDAGLPGPGTAQWHHVASAEHRTETTQPVALGFSSNCFVAGAIATVRLKMCEKYLVWGSLGAKNIETQSISASLGYMFSFLSNSINWNGSNCWVWIHLQMGEEGQFGWGNYEPCNFGVPIIWGTPSIEVKTGSSRQCFPWAVRRFMACPVTGICCSWSYPFRMILSDLGLVQHQTLFLCWILESNLLPTVWGLHWLWMNMYFCFAFKLSLRV